MAKDRSQRTEADRAPLCPICETHHFGMKHTFKPQKKAKKK